MVLIIVTLAGRFKTNKMRTSEHEEEGDTMPENNESRKVNLADAIRQKLEQKNSRMRPRISPDNSKPVQRKNEKPKQQKPNNQRRRTGGS